MSTIWAILVGYLIYSNICGFLFTRAFARNVFCFDILCELFTWPMCYLLECRSFLYDSFLAGVGFIHPYDIFRQVVIQSSNVWISYAKGFTGSEFVNLVYKKPLSRCDSFCIMCFIDRTFSTMWNFYVHVCFTEREFVQPLLEMFTRVMQLTSTVGISVLERKDD